MGSDSSKVVLFLQGPPGVFAKTIADALERVGARTLRVNLCAGDWISWHDKRCTSYRGSLENWPDWLRDFCLKHKVTHIVYYADRVPYHVAAAEVGVEIGATCLTYENGYLRPDWITLEHVGMSAHSRFPDDPEIIRQAGNGLPEIDREPLYTYPFINEAVNEVSYNVSNVFFALAYPRYQRDKLYHPIIDYLSNIPRFSLAKWRNRRAYHVIDDIIATGLPYYVFPLQLQSDYQLRYNSQYDHIGEAAEEVIRSFAANAPSAAQLVFKVHPLDNGMEPWTRILRTISRKYGVKKRVHLVDGGNLGQLLTHAAGSITINSTTGLHALRVGCPTKVLGIALYNIDGLTCQKPLDDFWRHGTAPDESLLEALERLLAASIQVKGCFYTREGREAGAELMADRIVSGTVNLPDANCEYPPRLEEARARKIATSFAEQLRTRGTMERWSHVWRP
ncbi:MAG: capsular biosynthesis protein [Roseibium sp.]|uniref:capsule biosynthesis protein n=1 Tax=Roseibium sp. TaxID=1936156 RepID=UPI001B0B3DCC|nr:capsular biosynthesis protein [Roseibium sp.]MBO6891338.1 capsular biosynthesis protein [Roseibium sp.]MBO6931771.1 capsular biosynthesis protein [Roseibium sp.]